METLLRPIQPEWRKKLEMVEVRIPTAFLKNSIAYVYQFQVQSTTENSVELPGVPDGCVDIILNMAGDLNDCFLFTSPKARTSMAFKTNTTYFGIRLLPLQTVISFAIPIREINGYFKLPIFEIVPSFFNVYHHLLEMPDLDHKLAHLEKLLPNNSFNDTGAIAIVKSCIRKSLQLKGNLHVKDLQIYTGYSDRYLRTIFKNEIGIPPKNFLEIVYFQYAIQDMTSGTFSMEKHLTDNNFYDVSHFYKKIKKITQMTPNEYLKLLGVKV